MSCPERLALVDWDSSEISLKRQCDLLGLPRSSLYYQPKTDSADIAIMKALDELYTSYPFYGHRRLRFALSDDYGITIGRKRTLSLMATMGLCPIYPRKRLNTSVPDKQHKTYPYLLKNLKITSPNQVWGTDITYIRLKQGFAYLAVILDWFSRYVISWQLSGTLQNDFCIQALRIALEENLPEIHNSDQGAQFTSNDYLSILEERPIRISMDGRGRFVDNIFTERLWRTIKYENVYLNDYENLNQAKQGLTDYLQFYNQKRRHQALNYSTPAQIYFK